MSHRVQTRRVARGRVRDGLLTTDADDVTAYLEDAAHYPGGHATTVACPRSEAEVVAVVQEPWRLLPVGAQSSLTGGATPMGETVVATTRLNRVIAINSTSIRVQAGVTLDLLQTELARLNAFYPPLPTYVGAVAGGVVATNAAGAATFKYGSTRDWVRGLTVVLANGSVLDLERGVTHAHPDGYFEIVDEGRVTTIRLPTYEMPDVPKRSAGYYAAPGMDLVDLFIGSEGTLGIVTEVSFAVRPSAPAICLVWITVPDEPRALELVATLRHEAQETWRSHSPHGVDISAIEHLDRGSLAILRAEEADRTHNVQIPDDAAVALLVQVELPADSLPNREQAYSQIASALSAGAPSTPLVCLCRLVARAELLDRAEIVLPQDRHRQTQLLAIREAVPEAVNRHVAEARRADPRVAKTAADMIVPFNRFDDSLHLFRREFERRSLDYAIWGHISDGNVHPNVIPRSFADVQRGQAAILECGRAIIRMGGCPLAEHGVGRSVVKQQLLRELYGDGGLQQMRQVKAALDPQWRMAPGVLFPEAQKGR